MPEAQAVFLLASSFSLNRLSGFKGWGIYLTFLLSPSIFERQSQSKNTQTTNRRQREEKMK